MKTFGKIVWGSAIGCVVASVASFFIWIGLISSFSAGSEKEVGAPSQPTILRIDFTEPITEQKQESFNMSFANASFDMTTSLYDYIQAIDIAAEDPNIKFLFITPDQPQLTITQAEEIREAIARFRKGGKAVISYSNTLTNGGYYIATAADKVILNPMGNVMITGISTTSLYFKDLLDKLGIEVQLIRHGKYKSAGEPFIRSDMSEANYQQNKEMVDAIWGAMVNEICEARGIDPKDFNKWVDDIELNDGEAMLEKGLVDELSFENDVVDYLCSLFGAKKPENLKFIDIAAYAEAKCKKIGHGHDKIAVVYCDGDLVMESDDIRGSFSGVETARMLEKIRRDNSIKAVVLRVNSPGGDAQAGELINHELGLLKAEKPVIASYGDYAASGGYWISARADRIFTRKTTLTGSIGVFSMIPVVGGALKNKLGVNMQTVGSNKHSDIFTFNDKLDKDEEAYMQRMIEKIYDQFLAIVAEGRGMTADQVDELAQGRVWTGSQAITNGLADEIGGLSDAIRYAEAKASLNHGEYKVVEYPAPLTAIEQIMAALEAPKGTENPYAMFQQSYSFVKESTTAVNCARLPYVYIFN